MPERGKMKNSKIYFQDNEMRDYFEEAPLSEKTLIKNKFYYKGLQFLNDFGFPCDYRVIKNGKELGRIKYYKGRKLMNYEVANKGGEEYVR